MTQQDKQDQQNNQGQQNQQSRQDPAGGTNAGSAQRADPGGTQRAENRSESLLPGDDSGDGRYEVAEEVNLDQQSDQLRHVGQAPQGIAADALPESLKGSDDDAGRQR